MSTYQRTTRKCNFKELRPELAEAIRAHAQRQQWANLEAEVVACCETITEKTSTTPLDAWLNGGATISQLALIATPDRLIWAFSSERGPCVAASARFKDMRLKLSTPRNKTGIAVDIYARMEGTRDKAGGRFVLDDSPAARQFCAEVERATDRLAEPLTRRPRRKWFRR